MLCRAHRSIHFTQNMLYRCFLFLSVLMRHSNAFHAILIILSARLYQNMEKNNKITRQIIIYPEIRKNPHLSLMLISSKMGTKHVHFFWKQYAFFHKALLCLHALKIIFRCTTVVHFLLTFCSRKKGNKIDCKHVQVHASRNEWVNNIRG